MDDFILLIFLMTTHRCRHHDLAKMLVCRKHVASDDLLCTDTLFVHLCDTETPFVVAATGQWESVETFYLLL
jgi:hypothetical protein